MELIDCPLGLGLFDFTFLSLGKGNKGSRANSRNKNSLFCSPFSASGATSVTLSPLFRPPSCTSTLEPTAAPCLGASPSTNASSRLASSSSPSSTCIAYITDSTFLPKTGVFHDSLAINFLHLHHDQSYLHIVPQCHHPTLVPYEQLERIYPGTAFKVFIRFSKYGVRGINVDPLKGFPILYVIPPSSSAHGIVHHVCRKDVLLCVHREANSLPPLLFRRHLLVWLCRFQTFASSAPFRVLRQSGAKCMGLHVCLKGNWGKTEGGSIVGEGNLKRWFRAVTEGAVEEIFGDIDLCLLSPFPSTCSSSSLSSSSSSSSPCSFPGSPFFCIWLFVVPVGLLLSPVLPVFVSTPAVPLPLLPSPLLDDWLLVTVLLVPST
ncbi:uncharacterized protein MELLADRAFT_89763 [Melampsora larici-populina 98AG31]|uniref:Uncharacterized protein n=1 Tax=Melampsora larici-populina (strain 98AG31 / pathotype 3-4-7) TaxID=747676 RepID=F4RUJ0_MELLP|nr:uncharacterized protein MELLADRAFT_89763 [Melampsora larici-populina 98AG31]EGG03944.1 hypothetical protein MELLADRAFT_89763 [Melampsora larici-populina 98AG31]